MVVFEFCRQEVRCRHRPVLLGTLIALMLSIGGVNALAAHAAARRPLASPPDPDAALIAIYKDLGANNLRQAQAKADALVAAYPNFLLAQLIRGDLLLMHSRPITGLGSGANATPAQLADLRNEAMVRLNSLRERPNPELVPRALLKLRDDQRYALLADTKHSRLFVYENLRGQLKLISDYYITQGKLGVHKLKEGDQKTPIGVYYITSRLPRARLPDFYGVGALPINYPNEWDRVNGRSGSGIWLHGTPSGSYSRPPLASDGCVVLTNPDLQKLFGSVVIGKTPVVIGEQVEFVSKQQWAKEREAVDQMIEHWRRDLESLNTQTFLQHYSAQFKSATGEDLATWSAKQQQAMVGVKEMSIKLQDETLFAYPDRHDLIVATFTQNVTIGKRHQQQRKRQYWLNEGKGKNWKVVYEGNI